METYKAGQGSFARLTVTVLFLVAAVLGCVELYSWIQSPKDAALFDAEVFRDLPLLGVPLSWKLLLCVLIFGGLMWLLRRIMSRPATVDALIETEQEMKKVSWPTREESQKATWIVVVVTVVLTGSLALFDAVLRSLMGLIF